MSRQLIAIGEKGTETTRAKGSVQSMPARPRETRACMQGSAQRETSLTITITT